MEQAAALNTMISVQDVYKAYPGRPVLNGVSFDVHAHEVVAIIGTSGCGKSTLLRLISGLEAPDTGQISLSDPNYSMVFQYSALFDSLSVWENVGFSLLEPPDVPNQKTQKLKQKLRPEAIRQLAIEKLALLGLDEDVADKYPNQLSGGMQKRVSFARAILSNPRIILYDEPTAGLDPIASTLIENYILALRNELNAASVMVTHQFSTIHIADRVCLLHNGQIRWSGTPAELLSSADAYAHQFAHATLEGPLAVD